MIDREENPIGYAKAVVAGKQAEQEDRLVIMQDEDILHEIFHERRRQDDKWGEQNHPDGTDTKWADIGAGMKAKCESKTRDGKLTFRDILEEEIWEAYGETDPVLLRAELVQSAAVIVNWIGAIDRRKGEENEQSEQA